MKSVEGKYFVAIDTSWLLQVFLNAMSKKQILCCCDKECSISVIGKLGVVCILRQHFLLRLEMGPLLFL